MQFAKGGKPQDACYAKGGPVIGTNSKFLKIPDSFMDPRHGNNKTDGTFGKGMKTPSDTIPAPAAKDKSLSPIKPR